MIVAVCYCYDYHDRHPSVSASALVLLAALRTHDASERPDTAGSDPTRSDPIFLGSETGSWLVTEGHTLVVMSHEVNLEVSAVSSNQEPDFMSHLPAYG